MDYLRLTDHQINQYNSFGFVKFPGMMADQVDAIIEAFEQVFTEKGGGHYGKPHDGKARSCIFPFIDQSARLSALLDDPRINGIASTLLGDDFNYMGSDGNYYVGETGWHSDGWHAEMKHLKIAFYLDPLTRDTGALRVIPGSHKVGDKFGEELNKSLYESKKNFGIEPRDVPCVALDTTPGDVLVFNHNTRHAAFGGSSHRRMFTINCCQRYPERLLPVLQDYIGSHARFWIDRYFGPKMLDTATPRRMRHLEQPMANDGQLPERARKARETMPEPSRG